MFGNNNFNNQMNGNFYGGIPQGTGAQYMGNPQPVKIQNFLTDEEIQKLIKQENSFSLAITQEEKMRATCNHRWANGQDAIVETPDGKCKCQICQYEFIPLDSNTSPEVLYESVNNVLDIIQTIKMLYINMPADAAREYFVIIPLIERLPKLFEHAVKCYSKYDNFDPYKFNDRNMGTMALFNMLSSALNNGAGYAQQPQQQAAPQQFFNPAMNMGVNGAFGYPYSNPMSNGFGFNTMGYQPQTNDFQYNPNQQMPQQQPGQTMPESTQATTDGSNVEVNSTFKA